MNIDDKIFFNEKDRIGFMLYNNAFNLQKFQAKYGYPDSKDPAYVESMTKDINTDKEINTPRKFTEYMIEKGDYNGGLSNKGDGTGVVVVAGYEDGIPKLYTFILGAKNISYKPENGYYNIVPYQTKPYNLDEKINIQRENKIKGNLKQVKVHCFEKYFGICFCITECISDCYNNRLRTNCPNFEKMSISEAVDYSRLLIRYTIEQLEKEGDKSVGKPIDTLIITKDGYRWKREPKSTDIKHI